jgi:hypothetical protein
VDTDISNTFLRMIKNVLSLERAIQLHICIGLLHFYGSIQNETDIETVPEETKICPIE